jgi:hypothetical protein
MRTVREIVAGTLGANVIILACDYTNPVKAGLCIIFIGVALLLRPHADLCALTVLLCLVTSCHATTSIQLKTLLWNAFALINPDFMSERVPSKSIISVAGWRDQDGSLRQRQAVLTRTAQQVIRNSQSRCYPGRKLLLVTKGLVGGFGAEQHWHAHILAIALEEDALFVWDETACTHFRVRCRDLYRPEHHCTNEQMERMRVENVTGWIRPQLQFPLEV